MLTKVHLVKAMVFPVVMYRCASWTIRKAELKNWCFWNVVLEKTLENPLDCKEIQPVNPKGSQPWIFIGRNADAEAKAPVLWPPDTKSWLIRKDPDAEEDWRQEEKEMTQNKMSVWHHQLNGHEFEQALEDGEGLGNLVCCSPWGLKELDTTEWLNNSNMHMSPPPTCDPFPPPRFLRAPVWVSWVTQQILTGPVFYVWQSMCFTPLPPSAPPSPSPAPCPQACFLSVAPLLPASSSSGPSFYIPYICINIQYLFFIDCFLKSPTN